MTRECSRTGTGSPELPSAASSAVSSGVELLELLGVPAFEDGADGVVAAGGRAQEAELGRLADDQADLGAGDVGLGSFLHAHRHDAQGLDRRRNARDRRRGRFEADVVRPPHAAP